MNPENFELMVEGYGFLQNCMADAEYDAECNEIGAEWDEIVQNDYTLTVGEKAFLFLFPHPRLFYNFW